jgi:hypothetical protein
VPKSNEWNILSSDVYSPAKQINFINNILKRHVQIKVTFTQMIYTNTVVTSVLVGSVVFVVVAHPYLLNQKLWYFVALSIWGFCISGPIYVKMDKPKKWDSHIDEKTGSMVIDKWFTGYRGAPFAYEGYIFAAITIGASLCFLGVYYASKNVKNGLY